MTNEIITGIEGISPLEGSDEPAFRSFFSTTPVCYANSWLYYLRATRNDTGDLGFKYVSGNTLIGIGLRNQAVYLIHPLGERATADVVGICRAIRRRFSGRIIVKKVHIDLAEKLIQSNKFTQITSPDPFLEEESYPEQMILLETLYGPGKEKLQSANLFKKIRRFEKYNVHYRQSELQKSSHDIQDYYAVTGNNAEKIRSYKQIIQHVSREKPQTQEYYTRVYTDDTGIIQGLYISQMLSENTAGLYCSVSSNKYHGKTEWLDYDFFAQLYQRNIRNLYLGGSETQGVDNYIKKFFPLPPPYTMIPLEFIG